MKHSGDKLFYAVCAVAAVGVIGSTALFMQTQEQTTQIARLTEANSTLQQTLNQTNANLAVASATAATLETELSELKEDLDELADDYRDERDRNEEFEDQIRDLAGTLGDLDKLASIDEELLMKYSRVSFLSENYIPERLKEIEEDWIAPNRGDEYFLDPAYRHLENLMEEAEDDGVDLSIVSAYRSFDEQGEIKGNFTQVYGTGANTFSADQGYSEHQLGTAVDFSTESIGYVLEEQFDQTPEFEWLQENAYKYGFILSYPPDNSFYIYEPWHWRFVGRDLARHINRTDDTFYTMDQREIDEYRLEFFD
jgi:D-alanyl-D-alanine carboxypeptidase